MTDPGCAAGPRSVPGLRLRAAAPADLPTVVRISLRSDGRAGPCLYVAAASA
jgi:hypothetical protein